MSSAILALLSNIGLIIFVLLYLYASTLYEGGTRLDPHRKSWDWINNFWCDLIWPTTLLDEPNRASKWGITANFILCFSMIFFFLAFSQVYAPGQFWLYVISISGVVSMICSMLIFSELHDKIIGVIAISAIPSTCGLVYGLVFFDQTIALYWGTASLVLVVANIYVYYINFDSHWLPFIQKIAFAVVLSWVFFINTTIG